MKEQSPHCVFCGASIAAAPHSRRDGLYCCEGCFLKEKEFRALEKSREESHFSLAEALAAALDEREHQTGLHSRRVACHTLVLAKRFTEDREALRQIHWGALLHDIGKIGVPDAVLLKAGPLSEEEWAVMRTHPEKGRDILARVPFLTEAAKIVLAHEERVDGTGYPRGLAGEAIPWGARVFAVVDTLDAMTSDRPYRKGLSFDEAKGEIFRMSGTQFDPAAVEAFLAEEETLRDMVALKCEKPPFRP
ncbi:MAG: HD-GYP domain-containing protein [Deltaproteobacteria bacterium]|nr:HD-GYP domain-containing protein [Deltaproteobacteria bacterium]